MEESLILGCVVGCQEVNLEDILKLFSDRGDEYDASPHACDHEGAVEVHCIVLKSLCGGGSLGFYPLRQEVDECLCFDSSSRLKDEFKCPKDPFGLPRID